MKDTLLGNTLSLKVTIVRSSFIVNAPFPPLTEPPPEDAPEPLEPPPFPAVLCDLNSYSTSLSTHHSM